MASRHVMLLSSGGLRSLVAAAMLTQEAPRLRVSVLHLLDGRDNAVPRLDFLRKQCDYYSLTRISEIDLPHVFGHGHGRGPDGEPVGTLIAPTVLLTALAHARFEQAERVVWPISLGDDAKAAARAAEQIQLCTHLADAEGVPMPRVETPLLEMTDRQVIELGTQLDAPWKLAWSCLNSYDKPCRVCPNCQRRRSAFDAAGLSDPQLIQPKQRVAS